ncbi:stage II sporulation protein R [Oceanobacillus sp. 143]|uniref:Stage II sporulation protein R n=1 Tax=Oceanobacillus zhaokaii TaxID=2052660 RepID=A0A345PKW1_9BACI|nr:stage II sporulation protein R [Oceanobacillus zhaokaii]AXI10641.1 stage II sporulation protein R [Oceanobacillus zhaokaii]QGS69615.1 stage II sporulation protein R [Oceanobacillus sp. 143]
MKKLVFFAFIFILIFTMFPTKGASQTTDLEYNYQQIPDEAIRLRILANSDNERDQEVKRHVRDRVNREISEWVKDITDIEEARTLIEAQLPEINEIVAEVIKEEGTENEFTVEYGENIAFPTKLYGTYLYPAGEYEAILITIGEGNGANWWCVLFPPLCFLDFSFGANVASAADAESTELEEENEELTEEEEPEVKFFLFEWFGWS